MIDLEFKSRTGVHIQTGSSILLFSRVGEFFERNHCIQTLLKFTITQ